MAEVVYGKGRLLQILNEVIKAAEEDPVLQNARNLRGYEEDARRFASQFQNLKNNRKSK